MKANKGKFHSIKEVIWNIWQRDVDDDGTGTMAGTVQGLHVGMIIMTPYNAVNSVECLFKNIYAFTPWILPFSFAKYLAPHLVNFIQKIMLNTFYFYCTLILQYILQNASLFASSFFLQPTKASDCVLFCAIT